jgi:hypothetical protein
MMDTGCGRLLIALSLRRSVGLGLAIRSVVPVPEVVSLLIADVRLLEFQRRVTFARIVRWWKDHDFEKVARADWDDVSAFIARIQSAEQSGKYE